MTDVAYAADSVTSTAVGVAIAATSFVVALNQISLARDYYDLYKKQRDFYYDIFQNTGELRLNNEVYAVGFYAPDYTGSGVTSSLYWSNQMKTILTTQAAGYTTRHSIMFSAPGLSTNYRDVDKAEIYDDWSSYMFRYEEHKRDFLNERRWAQNMDSLSYGVKEAATVERGLATSFGEFDKAAGSVVSSINVFGSGLSTYTAYNKAMDAYWDFLAKPQQSNFGYQ